MTKRTPTRSVVCWWIAAWAWAAVPLAAQQGGFPLLTNYAPADYDAHWQNWAIVEDDRGVFYVGNNSGVLEHDGVSWRLMVLPNRQTVRSLAKDADGRIWVGGVGDLGYLSADSVGVTRFVSLLEQVPQAYRDLRDVWHTLTTDEGVYFNTANAIFRWNGSVMDVWPAPETTFHVAAVVNGTLFTRQWGVGLMRLERTSSSETLELVPGGERFADTRIYVLLPFDDERVLVGTREEGLFLFDGERFEAFDTEADAILAQGGLYQPGAVLKNGDFALGTTSQGLVVIDRNGSLVEHLDVEGGLRNNTVLYEFQDRAGDLWLGLQSGLTRVEMGSGFTRYDDRSGLAGVSPVHVHENRVFVGGAEGVKRLDPSTNRFLPLAGPLTQVFDMTSVGSDLLIAGASDGVYRLEGDGVTPVRPSALGDYGTRHLRQWSRDSTVVWVGLTDGIAVLRRTEDGWVDEGRLPGVVANVGWSVESANGSLWFSTASSQVVRIRWPDDPDPPDPMAGEVTVFGVDDGVPVGGVGGGGVALLGDSVVFTGAGESLLRFSEAEGRFVEDSTLLALRSGHPLAVWRMSEDSQGRAWIASTYGPPVVATPSEGGGHDFRPLYRFRRDRVASALELDDGAVWMIAESGLIRYDPGVEGLESTELAPMIRRVEVGEGGLLYGGNGGTTEVEIAHGAGAITLAYAAPPGARQPRYRTRLVGFDESWSTWSEATERSYTNLPPRAFTFEVQTEGGASAAFRLTVTPPWYRTWWAYVSYVVTVAGVLSAALLAQRRRLLRKHQELAERKRIEDELQVGHRIQMGMLTTDFPKFDRMGVSAVLRPAREVGGDLYDVFQLDDRHLCCCVADVSGKGVPAALFMAISKTLVKAIAIHQTGPSTRQSVDEPGVFGWSTGAIMSSVNDELSRDNDESMFVTAFICIVDVETGRGMYTNAGHNQPYLLRTHGVPEFLTGRHGPVLGAVEEIAYGESELDLGLGEQLLLYTDGVTEAFNEHGELFTDERLERLVSELKSTNAEHTVQSVLAEVTAFEGGTEQTDDITVLALRRSSGSA